MMVGAPLGFVYVLGTNFASDAQVLVDGAPASFVIVEGPTQIEVQLPDNDDYTVATHTFVVQQASVFFRDADFQRLFARARAATI